MMTSYKLSHHNKSKGNIILVMIAVIFEVFPKAGHRETYLDIAAQLRQHLNSVDGFVSIERFQSLTQPDKILSLSFWRDDYGMFERSEAPIDSRDYHES